MSFNGNDIQFLSIPDRVKRLEVSLLKKVLGKYITNPVALTTVVENLELEVDELEYVENIAFDDDTFKFTITYRDGTTQVIDLPLEQMIVDVTYDDVTKDLTFELNNGNTLVVPLDDIIDGLVKTSDIVDNLTTDDATKVLSAKQGKVLQDGKLDKITTTGTGTRAYGYNNLGDQVSFFVGDGFSVINGEIPKRDNQGFVRPKIGNAASRPTTGLGNGAQYFNTDTKQMEVYIGDANHWLNQVYKNGDTLPTPASGTSHTYMVIGSGVASNDGSRTIYLGEDNEIYVSGSGAINDSIITINNVGGLIYAYNVAGTVKSISSLVVITDTGNELALKRIG